MTQLQIPRRQERKRLANRWDDDRYMPALRSMRRFL